MSSHTLHGKTIAILVANEFEDMEVFYPLLRLSEEGARIILGMVHLGVAPRPYFPGKPITGRYGLTVPPPFLKEGSLYVTKPMGELKLEDIDAVVIPGGFAPDVLRRDPAAVEIVRAAVAARKPVAAICHGPWLLFTADVVRGVRMTAYSSLKSDAIQAGALWMDAPAVRDGMIITSREVDDLPEFCQTIISALKG
jgi:protease I